MSDITNVSTPQEDEMANMAQRFFSRASDAIVQASKLAKVVEELQAQVAALSAEVAQVKAQNEQLVAELHNVTVERDDFRQRFWQSEAEHNETKQALADLQASYNGLLQEHQVQGELLATTQRTVSDMSAQGRALENHLAQAMDKLEAIAAIIGIPAPTEDKGEVTGEVKSDTTGEVKEASPEPDPTAAPSGAGELASPVGEQPHNDDGTFGHVPMAARDFSLAS